MTIEKQPKQGSHNFSINRFLLIGSPPLMASRSIIYTKYGLAISNVPTQHPGYQVYLNYCCLEP